MKLTFECSKFYVILCKYFQLSTSFCEASNNVVHMTIPISEFTEKDPFFLNFTQIFLQAGGYVFPIINAEL